MGFVILAVVVFGFAYIIIRKTARRKEELPERRSVESEDILYKGPAGVKMWFFYGWGTKTLGGYHLVVRTASVQVVLFDARLGAIVGPEWSLHSNKVSIELSKEPSQRARFLPFIRNKIWITIRGADLLGEDVILAVSPRRDLEGAWAALVDSGVHIIGEPPGTSLF